MTALKKQINIDAWKFYSGVFFAAMAILGFLINTVYSAVSLESRMFDDNKQKQFVIKEAGWSAEHRLKVEQLQDTYVKKVDYKEDVDEIKQSLKEINQYLRNRR